MAKHDGGHGANVAAASRFDDEEPAEYIAADDSDIPHDDAVRDPILNALDSAADFVEEQLDRREMLKAPPRTNEPVPETGTPPAGRTSFDQARSEGLRGIVHLLGPGLITGASDDDPSAIGTFAVAGAQFGYGMLWTPLFTAPLSVAVQELCARIALETGVGLGVALRRRFPRWLVATSIIALVVANTLTVGADIGAVASAGELLSGGFLKAVWLAIPVALLVIAFQLFMTHASISRVFKWLTLVLFAYLVTALVSHPDVQRVVTATFVPHITLSQAFIAMLVALLGTTIQPYLFFWQATSEVEEMRAAGLWSERERSGVEQKELSAARIDLVAGMVFAQLIMFCIMLTAAVVLHGHGKTSIQSAGEAASALQPFAGPLASAIFSIGIIGTGFLSIPVMAASATYAIKEFFGLRGSLAAKPQYRPTFYAILAASILAGTAMNFLHIDPIKALVIASVVNGLVAAPLLAQIVILGSDRRIMRDRVSGVWSRVVTIAATVVMALAALALVATTVIH